MRTVADCLDAGSESNEISRPRKAALEAAAEQCHACAMADQFGNDAVDATLDDLSRVRATFRRDGLLVRVNPLHDGTAAELDAVFRGHRHAADGTSDR